MSKKYLPMLIVTTLILALAIFAIPEQASASQLLGITPTPKDPPTTEPPPITEPPPTTEPPPVTEPPPATDEPTSIPKSPKKTAKPKATELVLLPATGEFPIDPGMGMQWFFALSIIFLIGLIMFRSIKGAKTKK